VLENLKDLGKEVAIIQAEHQMAFEHFNKDCEHRHPVYCAGDKKIVICTHKDNKRNGTNYAGCFYDSCPYVMFWQK